MAQFTISDFNNLNFIDGNILNAYELNILKQFVSTSYQASLAQLAISNLHVGPEPPTYEEYGDNYLNMLWLDTTDNADAGVSDSTQAIIEDLTNTVQDLSAQIEELQMQLALIIAGGGTAGSISAYKNCLVLEDDSFFALEDGSFLELEFASEPDTEEEESWEGVAVALEDGSILTTEDGSILIFG